MTDIPLDPPSDEPDRDDFDIFYDDEYIDYDGYDEDEPDDPDEDDGDADLDIPDDFRLED